MVIVWVQFHGTFSCRVDLLLPWGGDRHHFWGKCLGKSWGDEGAGTVKGFHCLIGYLRLSLYLQLLLVEGWLFSLGVHLRWEL